MHKIEQYRKLCSLNNAIEPYLRPSVPQILFTKKKIRLKLSKTGGKEKKITVIFMNQFDD